MTQDYEEIKIIEEKKEEGIFKSIVKWFFSNMKFLLIPGSRLEDLTKREIEYEKKRGKRKFIRRLKPVLTITGMVIIFIIVTFAVFAPWISPYTFAELNGFYFDPYSPASPAHILGTTKFGRDIFGRIIFGARASLTIALPAILFSLGVGIVIGITAGYYGGWVDTVLMRLMDILLAFPWLVLALVFISIFEERRIEYIMLSFGILGIAGYARLIRGSVLQAKELPYIQAARVAGAGNKRIMFKHILPNTIQPIIISFTFDIGGVILGLAAISFLNFSDWRLIEWGNDIAFARVHLYDAPWASFWPGIMILITVLGFMLFGDGLRDALDPRLKNL